MDTGMNTALAAALAALDPHPHDGKTRLKTNTGRDTPPLPKCSNQTRWATIERKRTEWLVQAAKAEAVACRDGHHYTLFASVAPKNVSPADWRIMHEYLFGTQVVRIVDPFFSLPEAKNG